MTHLGVRDGRGEQGRGQMDGFQMHERFNLAGWEGDGEGMGGGSEEKSFFH